MMNGHNQYHGFGAAPAQWQGAGQWGAPPTTSPAASWNADGERARRSSKRKIVVLIFSFLVVVLVCVIVASMAESGANKQEAGAAALAELQKAQAEDRRLNMAREDKEKTRKEKEAKQREEAAEAARITKETNAKVENLTALVNGLGNRVADNTSHGATEASRAFGILQQDTMADDALRRGLANMNIRDLEHRTNQAESLAHQVQSMHADQENHHDNLKSDLEDRDGEAAHQKLHAANAALDTAYQAESMAMLRRNQDLVSHDAARHEQSLQASVSRAEQLDVFITNLESAKQQAVDENDASQKQFEALEEKLATLGEKMFKDHPKSDCPSVEDLHNDLMKDLSQEDAQSLKAELEKLNVKRDGDGAQTLEPENGNYKRIVDAVSSMLSARVGAEEVEDEYWIKLDQILLMLAPHSVKARHEIKYLQLLRAASLGDGCSDALALVKGTKEVLSGADPASVDTHVTTVCEAMHGFVKKVSWKQWDGILRTLAPHSWAIREKIKFELLRTQLAESVEESDKETLQDSLQKVRKSTSCEEESCEPVISAIQKGLLSKVSMDGMNSVLTTLAPHSLESRKHIKDRLQAAEQARLLASLKENAMGWKNYKNVEELPPNFDTLLGQGTHLRFPERLVDTFKELLTVTGVAPGAPLQRSEDGKHVVCFVKMQQRKIRYHAPRVWRPRDESRFEVYASNPANVALSEKGSNFLGCMDYGVAKEELCKPGIEISMGLTAI